MTSRFNNLIFQMMLLIGLFALSACGTFAGNPEEKTPDDGTTSTTGVKNKKSLNFSITDAPIDDLTSVFINIVGLQIKEEGKDWIEVPLESGDELSIDLLQYQDGKSHFLGGFDQLDPGTYTETRLMLSDTESGYVIDNEETKSTLKIPSGSSSGLKIKTSFTVTADQKTDLTIDFDLRKSITLPGNSSDASALKPNGKGNSNKSLRLAKTVKYHLKPILRLIHDDESGTITVKQDDLKRVCLYDAKDLPNSDTDCLLAIQSSTPKDGVSTLAFVPTGKYIVRAIDTDGSSTDSQTINLKSGKTVEAEFE